jgi:hypothetical protein
MIPAEYAIAQVATSLALGLRRVIGGLRLCGEVPGVPTRLARRVAGRVSAQRLRFRVATPKGRPARRPFGSNRPGGAQTPRTPAPEV